MKSNRVKYIFFVLFTIPIFSCEDKENSKNPINIPDGMVICATGFIEITIATDSTVTGSWDITAADGFTNYYSDSNKVFIGPQIGTGQLAGNIKDGQIWINMDPRIADYNIFLNGNYSNEKVIGNWHLSVFRGPDDDVSGSFEINNENKYTAYIKE